MTTRRAPSFTRALRSRMGIAWTTAEMRASMSAACQGSSRSDTNHPLPRPTGTGRWPARTTKRFLPIFCWIACISSRAPVLRATITSVEATPRLTMAAATAARRRWLAKAATRMRRRRCQAAIMATPTSTPSWRANASPRPKRLDGVEASLHGGQATMHQQALWRAPRRRRPATRHPSIALR